MSKGKPHIDEFLRNKLQGYEGSYAPDWTAFEQKLDRAIFFRRMRRGAIITIALILLQLAIFGGGNILSFIQQTKGIYYQPRTWSPQHYLGAAADTEEFFHYLGVTTEAREASGKEAKTKLSLADPLDPSALATALTKTNTLPHSVSMPLTEAGEHEAKAEEKGNQAKLTPKRVEHQGAGYALVPRYESSVAVKRKSLKLDEASLRGQADFHLVTGEDLQQYRRRSSPYISPLQSHSRWSYSINAYPNFTFRKFIIDPAKEKFLHRDFIDATNAAESGGISLNVGLEVSRRIGPITYINSGLEYISYKTEANFDFVNFRQARFNAAGEIVGYNLKNESKRVVFNDLNVYHYLNIPLSISHEPWVNDHIRLNVEAGFSFLYFAQAEGTTLDYTTLEVIDVNSRSYRNKLGSAFMKVGATYHISPQFNLGFEPTLMYFTNTIYSEDYPFAVIPYSVGLNLKLQVKLN